MVAKKIVSEGNSSPLVSIIMNCYNGSEYLKESLNSVLNQTYKNWELIFWDNRSADNSAKIFLSLFCSPQTFVEKLILVFPLPPMAKLIRPSP